VDESLQIELTEEHLPEIHAILLRKRTWHALAWLTVNGVLIALASVVFWPGVMDVLSQMEKPMPWLLGVVLFHGDALIGLGLLIHAAVGFAKMNPRVIRSVGVFIMVAGAWNALTPFLGQAMLRRYGWEISIEEGTVILGTFQLAVGFLHLRVYRRFRGWFAEAREVDPDQRIDFDRRLRGILSEDEAFDAGRIKGTVRDRSFLNSESIRDFRGYLSKDSAILVTRNRSNCFVISREEVAKAGIHEQINTVKLDTEAGGTTLQLGPQSTLAVARWAGLPVTAKQMRNAVRVGLHLDALDGVVQSAEPDVRAAGVKMMLMYKKHADRVPELAAGYLDDPDPSVRREALKVLKSFADPIGEARAAELLHDEDNSVRKAAEKYLAAIGSGASSLPIPHDPRHS
jgi:HEAT repeat protein